MPSGNPNFLLQGKRTSTSNAPSLPSSFHCLFAIFNKKEAKDYIKKQDNNMEAGNEALSIAPKSPSYTGTQVNYYFVCRRKLWLFSHNLEMEHGSDLVNMGKLIHETSYERKFKEIEIGSIKIDFLEKACEVHEVKKSKRIESAHVYQLLYYLYYLKKLGVEATGIINYPLIRKKLELNLTEEKEKEIERILSEITSILAEKHPPEAVKKSYCKKCSYFELCWC